MPREHTGAYAARAQPLEKLSRNLHNHPFSHDPPVPGYSSPSPLAKCPPKLSRTTDFLSTQYELTALQSCIPPIAALFQLLVLFADLRPLLPHVREATVAQAANHGREHCGGQISLDSTNHASSTTPSIGRSQIIRQPCPKTGQTSERAFAIIPESCYVQIAFQPLISRPLHDAAALP